MAQSFQPGGYYPSLGQQIPRHFRLIAQRCENMEDSVAGGSVCVFTGADNEFRNDFSRYMCVHKDPTQGTVFTAHDNGDGTMFLSVHENNGSRFSWKSDEVHIVCGQFEPRDIRQRDGAVYAIAHSGGKFKSRFLRPSLDTNGCGVLRIADQQYNTEGFALSARIIVQADARDPASVFLTAARSEGAVFQFVSADAPAVEPVKASLEIGEVLGNARHLASNNGRYRLVMQGDGNLVGYEGDRPFWASETANVGHPPFRLAMQRDGNLVVYDRSNRATWSSRTQGYANSECSVVMQDDRNIVVYKGGSAIWSSSTNLEREQPRRRAYGDRVANGNELRSPEEIFSPNGRYRLVMQDDGNLVGYEGGNPFWSSETCGQGSGPFRLAMQSDGNLVVYDRGGRATWASGTDGRGSECFVVMQNDRNIVVYNRHENPGSAVWTSNTMAEHHGGHERHSHQHHHGHGQHQTDRVLNASDLPGEIRSANGRYRLVMQGDGNLVGYEGSHPFWSSETCNKGRPPFRLAMQSDGNLVVYDASGQPTWATGTNGNGAGCFVVMQNDRNIVVYNGVESARNAVWASQTNI